MENIKYTLILPWCPFSAPGWHKKKRQNSCAPMTRHWTSNSHHRYTQRERDICIRSYIFSYTFFFSIAIFRKRGRRSNARRWRIYFSIARCMFHEAISTLNVDNNGMRYWAREMEEQVEEDWKGDEMGWRLFWEYWVQ